MLTRYLARAQGVVTATALVLAGAATAAATPPQLAPKPCLSIAPSSGALPGNAPYLWIEQRRRREPFDPLPLIRQENQAVKLSPVDAARPDQLGGWYRLDAVGPGQVVQLSYALCNPGDAARPPSATAVFAITDPLPTPDILGSLEIEPASTSGEVIEQVGFDKDEGGTPHAWRYPEIGDGEPEQGWQACATVSLRPARDAFPWLELIRDVRLEPAERSVALAWQRTLGAPYWPVTQRSPASAQTYSRSICRPCDGSNLEQPDAPAELDVLMSAELPPGDRRVQSYHARLDLGCAPKIRRELTAKRWWRALRIPGTLALVLAGGLARQKAPKLARLAFFAVGQTAG